MVSTRKVHEAQRPPFEQWLASLDMSEETRQKLREISHMPEQLLVGQEMVEILRLRRRLNDWRRRTSLTLKK